MYRHRIPAFCLRAVPGDAPPFAMLVPSALLLLGALLVPLAAQAQAVPAARATVRDVATNAALYHIRAVHISGEHITVDGRLDEPAWASADSVTNFTQLRPDPGRRASQRTVVRVLYDADAIYVGAHLYDAHPDSIVARLMRRDDKGYSDWFGVAIDSYNDRRTAFTFLVNPRGVRYDELISDDTNEDGNWDAVWEAESRVDSTGWTTEIRIPLSQLRYAAADSSSSWGVQFYRDIARRGEESFWAPMDPNQPRLVSAFGTLLGLSHLPAPRRLEITPYGVSKLDRAPGDAADPFYSPDALSGTIGADLKYGVTPNMTLTATLNPDFGQVEADPSVVNLTAYETFFPEKRPFFQEGANIFHFGIGLGDGSMGNSQLFYSRRIGRAPQAGLPDSATYGQVPSATTILGAAKLSGKTASGWSIGALDAVTAQESAPYVTGSGRRGTVEVEPLTNYAVGRVIKDFRRGQSAIGGIFTATSRRLNASNLDFLTSSAYTGGINVRHRWAGGNYTLTAFAVGSLVEGNRDAILNVQESPVHYFQRPDATYLRLDSTRTSLSGAAAQLQVGKMGGGHWRWLGALHMISPGFEVNDLGFLTQADQFMQVGYVGYQQNQPSKRFRNWGLNGNVWHGTTFGGEQIALGGNVNGHFQVQSYWGGYGGINFEASDLSIGATRGGPALRIPANWNYFAGLYSDDRRSLSYGLEVSGTANVGMPGRQISVSPNLDWRIAPQAQLKFEPSISWNDDPAQYVAQGTFAGQSHYYFGHIRQTTVSLTTRLSYTVSPTLSFQLYAQPFVSAGRYSDYREAVRPTAMAFIDRFRVLGPAELHYDAANAVYDVAIGGSPAAITFDKPDFNFKQFRSTAVLRWQYLPGSTVFLVWSQSRTASDANGSFAFTRDFGRLFGTDRGYSVPADNVFLIKVSFWMGK